MNFTYNNEPALKERIQAGNNLHEAQGRFIRGSYWNENPDDFKGCSIGCTLHTMGADTFSDHELAAELTGLPLWVMRISDMLFENISIADFNSQFYGAIPVGVSFDRMEVVEYKYLLALLSDPEHGTLQHCDAEGKAATETVIVQLQRAIAGDMPSKEEWNAAATAAYAYYAAATAYDAAADATAAAAHYNWQFNILIELLKAA